MGLLQARNNMAVFCKLLVVLFVVLICRASEFGKWDFYAHGVEDVLGRMVRLDEYRGKVSLVVNVASECGYTDGHYRDMVKLQEDLGTEDFAVLAFPCNQFGNQEPHDDIEIEEFVRKNYGINFPLFSKIEVRGQQSHSIYAFLKGFCFLIYCF